MNKRVEFSKYPVDDIKKFTKMCDIGIIEGGCCNSENVEVLKDFRKNCKILVSVGECAIMGGLPALRNVMFSLVLIIIISGVAILFIILSAFSGNSKYSMLGCIRIICQLISFELIWTTILS